MPKSTRFFTYSTLDLNFFLTNTFLLIFFFLYLSFEKEHGQIQHEGQGCLQTLEIQKGNRRRAKKETVLNGSVTLESKYDGHRIIFIFGDWSQVIVAIATFKAVAHPIRNEQQTDSCRHFIAVMMHRNRIEGGSCCRPVFKAAVSNMMRSQLMWLQH